MKCDASFNEHVQVPQAGSATHLLQLRWLTDTGSLYLITSGIGDHAKAITSCSSEKTAATVFNLA